MRLSDIKGERTFEVIADIIEPIANIAESPASASLFRREKLPEGVSAKKFLLERAKAGVPVLLRNHKRDIIAILAAVDGVSPEYYEERLSMVKLISDTIDLLTDEAFIGFFTQTGSSSGDAQESTEAPDV